MEIFKLTQNDWEEFKKIRLEALREDSEAFGISYEESVLLDNNEWKNKLENPKNHIMIARDGEQSCGIVAAYQEEGEKVKHAAYVWGVYVNKAYRGKRIGKKLMEALLAEIGKNNEIEKINLNVNTTQKSAVKLYKKLGFKIAGTLQKELKVGEKYYDEYVMEKLLK